MIVIDSIQHEKYETNKQQATRNTKNASAEDPEFHLKVQNQSVATPILVPDTAHHLVGSSFIAKEFWDKFRDFFCPYPSVDIDNLLQEYWGLTVGDDVEVDEFFQHLTNLRSRISTLDVTRRPPEFSGKSILAHFQKFCD